MERLYLGDPNDAEVDALLSQLNDESLLKLKVNSQKTSAKCGFEYPTFTDGWSNKNDDAVATGILDSQLASRFSILKLPIPPAARKRGNKASPVTARKSFNSDMVGRKSRDSQPVAKKGGDSEVIRKSGRDFEVLSKNGEERDNAGRSNKSSSRSEDRSCRNQQQQQQQQPPQPKTEMRRTASQRTEFHSCRSSDAEEDDPEKIDAHLKQRLQALKDPPPPPSPMPAGRNVGLENLMQFSGQLSSAEYEEYGSPFSTPSSPSAKLLGRYRSRSSPRVMTNSVASSCHCSTPSPLKLLKQVSSKGFPSRQQQQQQLPPASSAPRSPAGSAHGTATSTPVKKAEREYKVEGFGNSKSLGKEAEKTKKEKKRSKDENNSSNNNHPSTAVKDMRRLLSSVADRVGLERSRVSSAVEEDDSLGDEVHGWSVLTGEEEFARVSTEEKEMNREAERVVEWAKDAARLELDESDLDSEGDDFKPAQEFDCHDSSGSLSSEGPSKVETSQETAAKAEPKKKKWGLF